MVPEDFPGALGWHVVAAKPDLRKARETGYTRCPRGLRALDLLPHS